MIFFKILLLGITLLVPLQGFASNADCFDTNDLITAQKLITDKKVLLVIQKLEEHPNSRACNHKQGWIFGTLNQGQIETLMALNTVSAANKCEPFDVLYAAFAIIRSTQRNKDLWVKVAAR